MKKIMFNDKYSLTQAVLDGRKTMTRRISKEQIRNSVFWKSGYESIHGYEIKPIYKISELVAIAQSYESLGMNPEIALNDRDGIGFYTKTKFAPGWKNKMFVRADLMPHHIRITGIKIERLQDISDEDCLKEGIYKGQCGSADTHFMDVYYYKGDIQPYCTPRDAFAELIDKVSGKGTWESNPYVFVYEFELVD